MTFDTFITVMKYLLLTASLILVVVGQLLLKKGVLSTTLSPNLTSIFKTIFTPYIFSGLATYGLSAVIWLFVLQKFPLSIAYPTLSLTYVLIVILSFFVFNEPITYTKVVGMILIIFGVYFLFK